MAESLLGKDHVGPSASCFVFQEVEVDAVPVYVLKVAGVKVYRGEGCVSF